MHTIASFKKQWIFGKIGKLVLGTITRFKLSQVDILYWWDRRQTSNYPWNDFRIETNVTIESEEEVVERMPSQDFFLKFRMHGW